MILLRRRANLKTFVNFKRFYNKHKMFISLSILLVSIWFSTYKILIFLIILELKKLFFFEKFNSEKNKQIALDEVTIAHHWANDKDLRLLNSFLKFLVVVSTLLMSLNLLKFLLLVACNLDPRIGFIFLIFSFLTEFLATCHIIVFRNNPVYETTAMLAKNGWQTGTKVGIALFGFLTGTTLSSNEALNDVLKKINSGQPSIGTEMVYRGLHGVEHSNPEDHSVYKVFKKGHPNMSFGEITENKQFSFTKIQKKFEEDPEFAGKVVISD